MVKKIILLPLLAMILSTQAQTPFLGLWEGKMNAGVELRMIFHFSQDASKNLIAKMDCPDQGIKDVQASTFLIKDDSIYLEISQFQLKYSGRLTSDSVITGLFQQGIPLPLNFKRIDKVAQLKRPQTPVGPFPYIVEELVYSNIDKTINYGATITIPNGRGPFPAVLLLTGSGQQNRDEEVMGHKPFAVIADRLTRHGFIVLRVDDRGMGKTTGDVFSATTRDFADDAIVSLNYLRNRNEVDKNKIGLIGHSEGGMIAQIIAAERKDIYFVIMLAAPGENNMKLMSDQNEAILTKSGMPKEYIDAYIPFYNQMLSTIILADEASQMDSVKKLVDKWVANTPARIVMATTGIKDEITETNFVNQFVGQVGRPWFKYFLQYDPSVNMKKISASMLALNGSKDIQVVSKSNLMAIEAALKNGKSKRYLVKELAGLNHLFQECHTCTVNEYTKLEQTISPVLLNAITDWMKEIL